jgi:MFS family permease
VIESKPFFHELREGWGEFRRQTWLWTTILFFGIGNFAFSSYFVLGPVIAKRDLGGAPAWAALTTAFSVGSLLGGFFALRFRPRKPLAASCMAAWPIALQPLAIAFPLPLPALVVVAALAGSGIAVHLALWFTVFQRQVPAESMSRVSSYDSFGSFVLGPLGAALAGPAAAVFGIRTTLFAATAIIVVTEAIVFAQPSVHAIRAPELEAERV